MVLGIAGHQAVQPIVESALRIVAAAVDEEQDACQLGGVQTTGKWKGTGIEVECDEVALFTIHTDEHGKQIPKGSIGPDT
eukprot:gene1773-9498_t